MRLVRHPFVERDLIGIADHIVEMTDGDITAAQRRLNEVDALVQSIQSNPFSGTPLRGRLDGWLVRHGGVNNRLTIVFKPDVDQDFLYIALIAFGGRNWMELVATRQGSLPAEDEDWDPIVSSLNASVSSCRVRNVTVPFVFLSLPILSSVLSVHLACL